MNSKIGAPKISFIVLSSLILTFTLGCSLTRNSDREEFDSKAVVQTPGAAFTCFLKTDRGPNTQIDNGTLIEIACGRAAFATTIVRVSR